ncbi:MAG: ATP-binding cassette domain-containing protein [Bacteroidaceae bacterium]|nr:ATP-binding cassette domain-containing protein [Bacteroidaceae bacterium]
MNSIIKTEKLVKIFQTEEVETIALNGVDIEVKEGEFVAIMGPSGCGKSTLLNILGLLDILRLYKSIVHMHKSIIVQLILFCVSFSLFAQNEMPERTILRNIKVIDEVSDTLLKNAQLNAYDANGKSLSGFAYDRVIIVNNREKFKGYVLSIEGRHDTIVIEAKVDGYTCVDTTLVLSKRKIINAVGNRYIWQDEIQLKTTSELSRELQELMVNATRILMVHAGDTVVYNAATLQLSAGSMLDDLVSFLPGAQLDSGGKITINGEKVTNLLVNGKDFFKGDPMVALTNLPYYIVDKIKVYHRGPELKNATRVDSLLAETGEKPLVMDVLLKKDYYEANAEIAGGMRTMGDVSPVYRGRAFALRLTDYYRLAVYATASNIGDSYKASHNGEWQEMNIANLGAPVVQQAGIDFSIESKDASTKLETTFDAQHSTNRVEGLTSEQIFYTKGYIFSGNHSFDNSNSISLDWKASLSKTKEKYSICLNPYLNFRKGDDESVLYDATFDHTPENTDLRTSLDSVFHQPYSQSLLDNLITSQHTLGAKNYQEISTGVTGSGRVLMPFTKEYLDFYAGIDYKGNKGTDIRFSQIAGRNINSYNENTRNITPNSELDYFVRISNALPTLGKDKRGRLTSQIVYEYRHHESNHEQELRRNSDPMADEIRDMFIGSEWPLDPRNSFFTDLSSNSHDIKLNLGYFSPTSRSGNYLRITASIPFKYQGREIKDVRNSLNQQLIRRNWTFAPNIKIFDDKTFKLEYEMQSILPEMTHLLDVTNSSNSLYRYVGNPNLKTSYNHAVDLIASTKRTAFSLWLNYNLRANFMQHQIKRATTYNRTTGVTTYQPRNIDGNWWVSNSLGYGQALDKNKRWNISLDTKYTVVHSADYINDIMHPDPLPSWVLNHRLSEYIKLSYAKNQFRMELNGKILWSVASSNRTNFKQLSYVDQSYGVTLMTPLFWGIDLDTDLLVYLRSGYQDPSMNTTEWQWNASLSTRLGKKKLWTARLVGFDLLHQLSNITRTLDSQGRVESWHNTIRSYVTLNLTYHFEMKPKKGIE